MKSIPLQVADAMGDSPFPKFLNKYFMLIWLTFWSIGAVLADGYFGYDWYRQLRAHGYPSVPGVVTHCRFSWHTIDSGYFDLYLSYDYSVNGVDFTGGRFRYGLDSQFRRYGEEIAERLPQGTSVDVYYNPDDPSDAVLTTGIDGTDLAVALFLNLWNVPMVLFCYWIAGFLGQTNPGFPQGKYSVVVQAEHTRVILERAATKVTDHPLYAAGFVMVFLSLAAVFSTFLIGGVIYPSLSLLCGVWVVMLSLSVGAYSWVRFNASKNLVINSREHTMALPRPDDLFSSRVVLRFDAIEDIDILEMSRKDAEGATIQTYSPRVIYTRGEMRERTKKLAEWLDRPSAESLVKLLRDCVGLPEEP
jgi:hypothetical protein